MGRPYRAIALVLCRSGTDAWLYGSGRRPEEPGEGSASGYQNLNCRRFWPPGALPPRRPRDKRFGIA